MPKIMRILLIILITLLAFNGVQADFYENYSCISSEQTDSDLSDYTFYEGKIYNAYCMVKGADTKSFRTIEIEEVVFGRDAKKLYYGIKTLEGINPDHFMSKRYNFAQYPNGEWAYYILVYDTDVAWLDSTNASGIDMDTFELIDDNYFRDKDHVYVLSERADGDEWRAEDMYYLETLEGVIPDNFSFGYKITDVGVYWYGKKTEEADVGTFKIRLEWSNEIGTDKNNVYEKGEVIYRKDVSSFEVYDVRRDDEPTLVVKMDKYKADKIKKEYPQEKKAINQSIKTALIEYKEQYPGYRPQPAIDPDNPPKHPTLDRIWDIITDYKYLNPPVYYLIILSPVLLVLGVVGFVFWRRKRKK